MRIQDAFNILNEGQPDIKLQFNCGSCDTDYTEQVTCCGKETIFLANAGMNTPYEEYELARAVLDLHSANKECTRLTTLVEDLSQGSRWK